MCGIAGFYFKNPERFTLSSQEIEDLVDCLLLGIEHRGIHATGIGVQYYDHSDSTLEKSDMKASRFIFWRQDIRPNVKTVILHTRHYTKGKPENILNNHPVKYDNVMMVHNGHISNDDDLFESENLERFAEVDSEIISAMLHKYSITNPADALEKLGGGYAVAAIDDNEPGKLLLVKGPSSPLVYLETDDMWIWASEETAIKNAVEDVLKQDIGNNCKFARHGEYFVIDNENHSIRDFQPYVKPYVFKGTQTNWQRQNYGGWDPQRDQCDNCFKYFARHQMNKVGQNYYCDQCESSLYDIDPNGLRVKKENKKLSKKERKRQRKAARRRFQEESRKKESEKSVVDTSDLQIGEVLDEEHKLVCGMVAEYYGTKAEFVDMILFSNDIIAEDDPSLASMYIEFEEKYQEYLEDVKGTTDIILNKITEEHEKKKYPTGFVSL